MFSKSFFQILLLACMLLGCTTGTPVPTATPRPTSIPVDAPRTPIPTDQWVPLPTWAEQPENPIYLSTMECENPLTVVDRGHILPVDQCDFLDLVDLNAAGIYSSDGEKLREIVISDVKSLFDDAEQAGYPLKVSDAWRSCQDQDERFEFWVKVLYGDENYANAITVHCGQSSHHLGTVFDLYFGELGFEENFGGMMADTNTYNWLLGNVAKYGCVLEYPLDQESITGFVFEPWHYRCLIPKDIAAKIMANEFTLAAWLKSQQ